MVKNIITYYPRAYVGNGGVTIALWKYAEAYKNKLVNSYVAFDEKLESKQPLEIKGIKKIKVKHYLFSRFRFPVNFLKNFSSDTVLVLHSGYLIYNLVAAYYANKQNLKTILIPHGAYHSNVLKKNTFIKKLFIFFESLIYKNLYFVMANNYEDLKHIKKVFKKKKISIIPIPIKIEKKSSKKNKFKTGKYFSYIGRYDIHTKGLDLLIQAYKEVPRKLRIPIILHGRDCKYGTKNDLIKLVKSEKLENIIDVRGPISGKKKENFLSSSFMGIFLSRNDGFIIGAMEHLAKNKPCLISKKATIWKMVEKNNLGLVTDLKIKSIRNNICSILKDKNKILRKYKTQEFIKKNLSNKAINKIFYDNFK